MTENKLCCSAETSTLDGKYSDHFVLSTQITRFGFVPVISSKLLCKDKWEHFKCRVSKFRNNYSVNPGLYAVGKPQKESIVFVSANYKFSFDILRKNLSERVSDESLDPRKWNQKPLQS